MSTVLDQVLERFELTGAVPDPIGERLWRIGTPEGPLALRAIPGRSRKGEFALAVLEHLLACGCPGLPRLRRTTEGSLGVRHSHVTWLVSEWVDGHGALLGLETDALAAARGLARFHLAATGFVGPQGEGSGHDRYGRLPSRLHSRIRAMRTYALVARNRLRPTAMDSAYQEIVGTIVSEMEALAEEVERAGYDRLTAESRRKGDLAYRAVGEGGMVITNDAVPRAVLVEWSAARMDCHLRDTVRLLARIAQASGGNCELVAKALAVYQETRPLSPDEVKLLSVLLGFPDKVYKVAQRYYENRRDWSELKAIRRLNRAIAAHRRLAACAAALRT